MGEPVKQILNVEQYSVAKQSSSVLQEESENEGLHADNDNKAAHRPKTDRRLKFISESRRSKEGRIARCLTKF